MNEIEMNHEVGFRFHPTDEELIKHYLKRKVLCLDSKDNLKLIAEVNVLKHEPWDLPDFSAIKSNDPYWYFFYQLDYKYVNSTRANRITKAGYWKSTGTDGEVTSGDTKQIIGKKKILVFHKGVSKKGMNHRTEWVIHEYRARNTPDFPNPNAYVICCLRKGTNGKTRKGTNGKTYNRKKKNANGKASTSAHVEGESSQLPFDFVNHVAENTVPEGEGAYLVDPPSQVDQLYNHQVPSYQDLPLSNGFSSNPPSQGPFYQDLSLSNGVTSDTLSQAYLETNRSNFIGCPRKDDPETIIGYFELLKSQLYVEQGLSYQGLSLSNGFSSDPPSQADPEDVNCYFALLSQLYGVQEPSYLDLPLSNGYSSDCNGGQTQFGNIEQEEDLSPLDSNLINEREAYPVETISHKNLALEGESLDWDAVGMSSALPLESISETSSIENSGMSSDANNEVAIAQATEHVTAIDLSTTTNFYAKTSMKSSWNGQAGNSYKSFSVLPDTPRHII